MVVGLQIKISSDINQTRFIRENPIWYKYLNRNPSSYKDFINAMKDKYKLNMSDKFSKMINDIGTLEAFLEAFK